uniref:C2H2-type domain-containing protein n=1 Tax=Arundo donax TaxID=35708 RepID=A0A0A9E9K6_ARUDO
MAVIRDALLLQLRMDRLRQQIIVAELAKIERTMALRSASHLGIATAPVEGDKAVPFTFSEEFMPHGRWPVNAGYYAHMDEVHGLKKDESQGGVGLKSMRPAMEDRMGECLRPCCNAKVGQENGAADEHKLQECNEAVPPKRTLPSAQWELTGITIPVKKPKSLLKWSCAICQVQTPSERHLQEHWAGKKHRSIVATLESINNSQKAETTAEHSSYADQKTSPIKCSCSTCQANGTGEADLKEHLNGIIHQQKIDEGQQMEGDGMAKNVEPPEAECHKSNVPQHADNPPAIWSGNSCRANCTNESDLGSHLLVKIQALLNEITSMARNSESREAKLPPNIVPHYAEQTSHSSCSICQANCDCQSDLENHLGGKIHQMNVQTLDEEAKQTENIPPQIAKNQGPPSESDCSICQAKCNSEPQSEHQRISRRRRKKIEALQREGKDAELGGLNPADKLPSDGCDNKSESSEEEKQTTLDFCEVCNLQFNSKNMLADHCSGEEHLEKQKLLNYCDVCDLLCNSEKMLVHHRTGKKHLKKLNANT